MPGAFRRPSVHVVRSGRIAVSVNDLGAIMLACPDGLAVIDPDSLTSAIAECEAWAHAYRAGADSRRARREHLQAVRSQTSTHDAGTGEHPVTDCDPQRCGQPGPGMLR